jgi:cytoskeletal protein CcmA (bactofilin family)
MKISGSGKLSEMSIKENIVVSGSVKMDGNIECQGFRSSGSTRGEGSLTAHGDVKSSGSFRILGALHGDGNAKFSGSTTIGEEIDIKGVLENSGSLRSGDKIEALQGIRLSGSAKVGGGLFSQKNIDINGSTTIKGDISGDNVYIGDQSVSIGRKKSKRPYIVDGNIFAANNVEINNIFVQGDVKGRSVKIGKRTDISGKVYYVDIIEVDDKATLAHAPIQITEIAEKNLEK